jgi:hypothetical protein
MPDETYHLLGHVPAGQESAAGIIAVPGAVGYDVYLSRGRTFELPEADPTPSRVVPAVGLHEAIRDVLEDFCSDSCAETGKRAILGVLTAHKPFECGDPDEPDFICSSCRYFTGDWPCPTLAEIVEALGIEVGRG